MFIICNASHGYAELGWRTALELIFLTVVLLAFLSTRRQHKRELRKLKRQLSNAFDLAELERREKRLLDEIIHKVNAGLRLPEILEFVFDQFKPMVPYERIGFAVIEDNGRILRAHWSKSAVGKVILSDGYFAPMASTSLAPLLDSGVPRVLNDLPAYLQNNPQSHSTKLIVEEGMKSSLTCPLFVNGKAVGFLFFSSTSLNAYQPVHVERFVRVARQLALIIEKARCYEEKANANARLGQLMDDLIPPSIHGRLVLGKEELLAETVQDATVMFVDLVKFSEWSAQIPPQRVVRLLNKVFSEFDRLVRRYGLCKIGTQGDSYLVLGGAPSRRPNHLEAVASLAIAFHRVLERIRKEEDLPIIARIGIHVGPVIAGVVGQLVHRYDVWGSTVNLASRLETSAEPGSIHVSQSVYRRLVNRFVLIERGQVSLKGFGTLRTYVLVGPRRRHINSRENCTTNVS